jgi:hypothetical protein
MSNHKLTLEKIWKREKISTFHNQMGKHKTLEIYAVKNGE